MIPAILGLAKLAQTAFRGEDMAPLCETLTARLREPDPNGGAEISPAQCAALMDMALIGQMRGSPERGLHFQAQALQHCRVYQIPASAPPARRTVLGFMLPGKLNANTPAEFLLEQPDITLLLLFVVPGLPLPPVPAHDAAIVLVADSEEARPALAELEALTAHWPCPVLNRPACIPRAGRERLHSLLSPLAGIAIPETVRAGRAVLAGALTRCGFPAIVRPVDSHAGDGLQKLDCPQNTGAYLAERPETEFSVSPFCDYRSADGMYRKYRIVMVAGKAFPCHLAISEHWMIHYLNAGMEDSAEKRGEEAQFLNRFDMDFGRRHRTALNQIAAALELDYFGLDCAELPDGRLLVFEAGTALVVHAMDDPDLYPYKARHAEAIFAAFQALL